ncbi:MAG: hypothetical protein ACPHIB_02720 [Thalassobaculaceae bacterium]
MTTQAKQFATLDSETVGLYGDVYDLAWSIHNKRGEVTIERNWLVRETFTNPKKMMGAFYAGKLFSHYAPMLERGEIKMASWFDIIAQLHEDIEQFGVNVIAAYNAGFDLRVIAQTHVDLGGEGEAIPSDIDVLDIWQFACETKLSQKQYRQIALDQGWISPAGNIKTGAEFAFRFCSGDLAFIEDHTALSDVRIEVQILAECFRQKKSVPYNIINASPWRIVNPQAGDDAHIHGSKVA